MEEPKASQNPPPTATQIAAPPQPSPPALEQPASKKRSLENSNDQFQDSNYFKMRLLLKDLRPHFIEVLRTPDFRNCKAATEIKEKMKVLLELYKQMTSETVSKEKCIKTELEQAQVVKPASSSENKTFQSSSVSKQKSENGEAPETHIVGGSAFGWNFITFPGNEPVYYGVARETFRSAQAALEEE
ncbi:hypothetical protein PTKIN_Ptkin15bG0040000 [Pterospermum kingtungense]